MKLPYYMEAGSKLPLEIARLIATPEELKAGQVRGEAQMTALITVTPRGKRYYLNSKRVSKDAYDFAHFWADTDTYLTRISKTGIIRHLHSIRTKK